MRKLLLLLIITSTFTLANNSEELTTLAKKYLGGKYVWGGETPKGFDCSGYTQYIFKKVGINLPRTAYQQSKVGESVTGSLKKGDLIFFNTDPSRSIPVTHVGVYLENGKFIHAASSKKGIIISPLTKKYQRAYLGAKRILRTEENNQVIQLPKDFFIAYQKALVAPTKVKLTYNLYSIYKDQYLRESEIKELKKMEEANRKKIQDNKMKRVKKVDLKTQKELLKEINQKRIPSIPITYSAEEAEELGAFEENALSEEDAREAIEESI
jgi:hypothetical protein